MYSESRKHPSRQITVSVGNLSVIVLITVCTHQRRRILARNEIHDLMIEAWKQSPEWTVGRYVILPDHVHLFAAENEFQGYFAEPMGPEMESASVTSMAECKRRTDPAEKLLGPSVKERRQLRR